jgi:protein-S-isoprenylcysteine O-methyltransferase Ste14
MKVNVTLLVGQIAFLIVVFAGLLFLAAGTLNWLAGWVFLILFFGFVIGLTWWLYQNNPALLTERMTGNYRADQKARDVVLIAVIGILFFAWLILMPLDAVRFQWSHMPGWLQVLGAIILIGSFYGFFATFKENSYLSPAIRVQEERGQTVISTGPYHYVRHPMYAAFLLFVLGTPLLLGSWYGLLFGLVLVLGVARRAVLEEATLRSELQGYDAYMRQVKYRLVPYVW